MQQRGWTSEYCLAVLKEDGSCSSVDTVNVPTFVSFCMRELRGWRLCGLAVRIRLFLEVGKLSQERMEGIKRLWSAVPRPPSVEDVSAVAQVINPAFSAAEVEALVQ